MTRSHQGNRCCMEVAGGSATLEVSIAIMESASQHRDVMMGHQVRVPRLGVDAVCSKGVY